MDKIVNISLVDSNNFQPQYQSYSIEDESLISNTVQESIFFDPAQDYLEYFIFDLNKNILFGNVSGWPNFSLLDNQVVIDPQRDLEAQGFTEGQYYTLYNFLKRKLSSTATSTFYIQEISSNRTELRLNTTKINADDVIELTRELTFQINNSGDQYLDFYLNFGDNKLVIANNIALDTVTDASNPTVLVKLYEPLPNEFDLLTQCWIVEQISEPIAYSIEIQTIVDTEILPNYISGPNFNIDIQDQINNSTIYFNLNSLNQSTSLLGSGSLLYQINSILAEKGIEINIDYSDYSQFVYLSSAQTRLENFYYKLALIETYEYSSSLYNGGGYFVSQSQTLWQNKINDIITNFDGYEYYLYYESGSYAWPKTNSTPPYINSSVYSSQAINWIASQSLSASLYDSNNRDALTNTIPLYLIDDPSNNQYKLFIQMVGQHFDSIWLYLKDITNKFDADNRVNYGISKDIVAQAIRDLGIKIYQNNFSSDNLYSSLLGMTPSGSLFNIPNITGSLPIPTGSGLEYINTVITASATGSLIPVEDINKEIYKRIYHNLPILLKKKGTTEGLKMLLDIYGIPDTILRVNEFGGKSYQNQSWDNFVDQFNYTFTTNGNGLLDASSATNGNVTIPYQELFTTDVYPTTLQFRFKVPSTPLTGAYNQLICGYKGISGSPPFGFALYLQYSGSNTGSYSGAPENPYNQYANLVYIDYGNGLVLGSIQSCSVYLPFLNDEWWSVMVTTSGSNGTNYGFETKLYAANNIYDGYDGSQIGFQASASLVSDTLATVGYNSPIELFFPWDSAGFGPPVDPNIPLPLVGIPTTYYYTFNTCSYQEIRFYGNDIGTNTDNVYNFLPKSIFDDYVMNPYSIEGESLEGASSSFNTLCFRAPLGTVLDNDITQTSRESVHPAISQYPPTQSFNLLSNSTYTLHNTFTFEPNTEVIYQDQFTSGIKNSVSEKIRIVDMNLPPGKVLSQYISIQQNSPNNEQFTKDVNYFEAAFSPQDEINDDIIAQLGSFNLGSYIGDPRYLISGSLNYYPDFNKLRDYYFSKYTHNYDLNDYIRLIKFYDNSLFKMIKDFTPAKTGLASGIVIKQTLLERNRYPQPKVNTRSVVTFIGSPVSKSLNIFY